MFILLFAPYKDDNKTRLDNDSYYRFQVDRESGVITTIPPKNAGIINITLPIDGRVITSFGITPVYNYSLVRQSRIYSTGFWGRLYIGFSNSFPYYIYREGLNYTIGSLWGLVVIEGFLKLIFSYFINRKAAKKKAR